MTKTDGDEQHGVYTMDKRDSSYGGTCP